MAAKKKSSKSGSAPKRTKTPKAPTIPKGSNDNATAGPAQKPTADQMVTALAGAVVGVLNGQNAAIAMNALAAATARICLVTDTNSVDFAKLLTAQVEVQARLMLKERPAAAPPKGGKKGKGK